jgi:hypothetical protein
MWLSGLGKSCASDAHSRFRLHEASKFFPMTLSGAQTQSEVDCAETLYFLFLKSEDYCLLHVQGSICAKSLSVAWSRLFASTNGMRKYSL